jgi:hypothetical protein
MKLTMKMKQVWVIVAVAAVMMIVCGVNYVRTHSPHPGMGEYRKVLAAASEYSHRLKAQGLAVPASVTLEELIKRGVLREGDVGGFDGLQVSISLKPDETHPQDALMSVSFPDGREVVALEDGSIQQRGRR